jgi:isopenicillin N synthase-like dioxygenase
MSPSPTPSLPIFDVGLLRSANPADREEAGRQLAAHCRRHGFFYIRNHGVPEVLQREVFAQSEAFFALPMDSRMALDKARSRCNRGYEPLRNQTLEKGSPPDLKEGFYIGLDLGDDDPRVRAGRFNHGPNQWPAKLPGFRGPMSTYFDTMMDLGALLMRGLALSLGLPERHFDPFTRGAMGTLRLLHYPPQPPNPQPGEKGCGAHTDFGAVTLLLQDDSGGLQVRDEDSGHWVDAPPIPGTYVVNMGDLISRWTNGHYRSDLHRVINASGGERYSVPFFYTGNPDHLVECFAGCLAPGETPRWPVVTVEQHLSECYARTYA